MPVSEAKKKANHKWEKENCKQVKLILPNEEAERLTNYCKEKGYTKMGFIRRSINNAIERNE